MVPLAPGFSGTLGGSGNIDGYFLNRRTNKCEASRDYGTAGGTPPFKTLEDCERTVAAGMCKDPEPASTTSFTRIPSGASPTGTTGVVKFISIPDASLEDKQKVPGYSENMKAWELHYQEGTDKNDPKNWKLIPTPGNGGTVRLVDSDDKVLRAETVIQSKCMSCHLSPKEDAPTAPVFDTNGKLKSGKLSDMLASIQSGSMPQGRSISAVEIQALQRWQP